MANIINGTDTGSGGLITTGDSSDELQLQTAETTALTITSGQQSVFIAGTAAAPAVTTTGDLNTGIFFSAADTLVVTTGGTAAVTVDSGQRTKFPTTIGVGGATPSTSGSGISFPASASASSDANTLDDYEEGTFTPAWKGSTTDPSATYNWRYGYYTKIGNQVTVWFGLSNASYSGGSGNVYINLPFASANRANNRIPGSIKSNGGVTYSGQLLIYNYENTTECWFSAFASGSDTLFLSVSAIGNTGGVQCCLTYTV